MKRIQRRTKRTKRSQKKKKKTKKRAKRRTKRTKARKANTKKEKKMMNPMMKQIPLKTQVSEAMAPVKKTNQQVKATVKFLSQRSVTNTRNLRAKVQMNLKRLQIRMIWI